MRMRDSDSNTLLIRGSDGVNRPERHVVSKLVVASGSLRLPTKDPAIYIDLVTSFMEPGSRWPIIAREAEITAVP